MNINIGTTEKFIEIDTSNIRLIDGAKSQILSVITRVNSENGGLLAFDILCFRLNPILHTDLPNVELVSADPTVTSINVTGLNLSEINETHKPEECIPQSAYMIDSTGAGNFTLRFTDIPNADLITVFKIDPTTVPPNQWMELDTATTADTVTFTISLEDPPVVFGSKAPEQYFDTGKPENPYPSIMGTHTGTIKPNQTITVHKMYTYTCVGTGGHTEYARIWNNSGLDRIAKWDGYIGDYHNISFNETFVLYKNKTYNYTIHTGSYPQIIHTDEWEVEGRMGIINCTSFVDANGKVYTDWVPAIRLWAE